jgi:hypothetical protein
MADKTNAAPEPPKLRLTQTGDPDIGSMADLLEFFLNFDERTARMRHPSVNELFVWKQADDEANGTKIYPFENAEARFAVGVFQAVAENNSEPLLKLWLTDVLGALQDARETRIGLTDAYKLDDDLEASHLEKAEKLTTTAEKRVYLTCCWLEALCTAEARFLGYVYQQIYGRPFSP